MTDQLPYSLVATDLDGTLLLPDHTVPPLAKEVFQQLLEKGVHVVLATGRNYSDIAKLCDNFSLKHGPSSGSMFAITSNGACIHDLESRKVLEEKYINPDVAERLFRYLPSDEQYINANAYQKNAWYARLDWPAVNEHHKATGTCFEHVPEVGEKKDLPYEQSSVKNGDFSHITKIFFLCYDPERLKALAEEIKAHFDCESVAITFSSTFCMDVMAGGINKGAALGYAAKRLLNTNTEDEALARTVAFGDGLNDAEMLRRAKKGYVMGNCNPLLKEELKGWEVIGTNAGQSALKTLIAVFGLNLPQ